MMGMGSCLMGIEFQFGSHQTERVLEKGCKIA